MFRLGKVLVHVRATLTLVPCALSAVVDPMEDIEPYIEVSEASDMKIRYVIDTHVHADHISGGSRLAEAPCRVHSTLER